MSYNDHEDITFDQGWVSWAEPYSNSWVNYAAGTFGVARYCRVNGIVYVNMMVKDGTDSTTVVTLPVGFRPSLKQVYTIASGLPAAGAWGYIGSDGQIKLERGDSWASFVVSFPAEQ